MQIKRVFIIKMGWNIFPENRNTSRDSRCGVFLQYFRYFELLAMVGLYIYALIDFTRLETWVIFYNLLFAIFGVLTFHVQSEIIEKLAYVFFHVA